MCSAQPVPREVDDYVRRLLVSLRKGEYCFQPFDLLLDRPAARASDSLRWPAETGIDDQCAEKGGHRDVAALDLVIALRSRPRHAAGRARSHRSIAW